jgi:hypothetical protein
MGAYLLLPPKEPCGWSLSTISIVPPPQARR